MKLNFKKVLIVIIALIAVIGGLGTWRYLDSTAERKPLAPTAVTYDSPRDLKNETPKESTTKPLPPSLLIKVPFTPQAPTANWDELHNEACEEASAIMANAYFSQIKSLPPAAVEAEISKLTSWQNENFGYHLSIDNKELVRMIEANYELEAEIVPITETTIKRALADNKLVIWPGNGQIIGNPYYTQPGPIYHMMLITGYNEQGLIANDPGTKRGQDYQYSYQTLYDATGTWYHEREELDLSEKNIIIVSQS